MLPGRPAPRLFHWYQPAAPAGGAPRGWAAHSPHAGRAAPTTSSAMEGKRDPAHQGPFGVSSLRETGQTIRAAGLGTGFAPVKALIEHSGTRHYAPHRALHRWAPPTTCVLCMTGCWRARPDAKLCATCRWYPTHCQKTAGLARTGFVHQAVLDDFTDLRPRHQVYACAPPSWSIRHAGATPPRAACCSEEFFADAFHFRGRQTPEPTTHRATNPSGPYRHAAAMVPAALLVPWRRTPHPP